MPVKLQDIAGRTNNEAVKALVSDQKIKAQNSDFFFDLIISSGLPKPEQELRFHHTRRWRFDYAWPELMLAVEVEGGIFTHRRGTFVDKKGKVRKKQSRHLTIKGFEEDAIKYANAEILGWHVMRFSTRQCKNGVAIDLIKEYIEKR